MVYLPYFEGVYHTRMIETYSNVNARMVHNMCIYILHSRWPSTPCHVNSELDTHNYCGTRAQMTISHNSC